MSTGRRAYDLLRGYVNREWDRIHGVELDDAEKELNQAIENPYPRTASPQTSSVADVPRGLNREEKARAVLGVSAGASFEEVRKAFERLNTRSLPTNFPANSPEASQAAEIQKRVQWAYGVLTEDVDTVEKRFRSLEIE